jgi:hypothetical protein
MSCCRGRADAPDGRGRIRSRAWRWGLQRHTGEVGVEPNGGEDLAREETRTVGELARAAAGGEVGVQDAWPETGEAR